MANDDIRGTITDGDGNAISGATVYLFLENNPSVVETTTTDSNGNYVFNTHDDGGGTTQDWHVAAAYEDPNGNLFNTLSKPGVSAAVPRVAADFVETLYRFEDQCGPTEDIAGSSDGDLVNSRTFDTSDPRCGSVAYDNSDTGSGTGYVSSQSTTDLVANGSETAASVGGFIKASSVSDFTYSHSYGVDSNNYLHVRVRNSNWEANLKVGGISVDVNSGIAVSTSSYQHVMAAVDTSTLYILVDGTLEGSTSHSLDITNIGSGNLEAGRYIGGGLNVVGLYDNALYATTRVTESDQNELINRC